MKKKVITKATVYGYGDPVWRRSGLPLMINIPGERVWVYYYQKKPVVRYVTREDIMKLSYSERQATRLRIGQASVASSADAPFWIYEHTINSFNKLFALRYEMYTKSLFWKFILSECHAQIRDGNKLSGILLELGVCFKSIRESPEMKDEYIDYKKRISRMRKSKVIKRRNDVIPANV